MRVAIIGAGLSGLACAYELKRNGIIPTIFEKKSFVGEVLDLPTVQLRLFDPNLKDPLKVLSDKYKLNLTPHYTLNEIITVTSRKTYTANGEFGHIFLRGIEPGFLTTQLKELVTIPYNLNTLARIEEIKKDFDRIVVATGGMEIPLQMNLATVKFDAYVRIANILGDFNVNGIKVWFNTKYAKHGFAYLVPVSNKHARLILIVDNISDKELDFYWEEFLSTEKIDYDIIETKDVHHLVGSVFPLQVDNIYFVGNAGGFIDTMLGFGAMKALQSGVMAAECIVKNKDYTKFMKSMVKDMDAKYEFRKVFNTFTDKDIDRMVRIEHLPLIKPCIFNNPILRVTQGTFLAKAYNTIVKK